MNEPPGASATRFRWLRWSLRDLRRNWVSVVTIALVLAIGIGVFAGLGSTAAWRQQTNDASFAAVRIHDLRVELSTGSFTDEGSLLDVIESIPSAAKISAASGRLVVDSQVSTISDGEPLLVRARIVGTDVSEGSSVDAIWLRDGERPAAAEATAILEVKFSDYHDLGTAGTVEVAGGQTVEFVGLGAGPEEFFLTGPNGEIFAESDFAILYVDLAVAQELSGHEGDVNDAVLTLSDPSATEAVAEELREALDEAGIGATVANRDDTDAYSVLYEDIESDQQMWNAISALILFAAALAAFNLVSRVVESQRREIGIGLALGVTPSRLAIRPMLVGLQVAVLGVLAGVVVGLLVGLAMKDLLESFLPLPHHEAPFQFGVFARAAALGFVVPIVASAVPTWRAVRVEPIVAIRTGHLAARGGRLSSWAGRLRLPGSSLTQMPVRNILRTPRRTLLTVLGVAAAITSLVAVLGMLDSFESSIETGSQELNKASPERVTIQLDNFYEPDSEVIEEIRSSDSVERLDAGLRFPAQLVDDSGDDDIDLIFGVIDLDAAAWTPTLVKQAEEADAGILLAAKAAADMGVGIGDTVTLRHPQVTEAGLYTITETDMTVSGIHPNPVRTFAFADLSQADLFGFGGFTNVVEAFPAEGATSRDIQIDVFAIDGVTSTQPASRGSEIFDEALEQFVGFLYITVAAVLLLALLIAFNASRITVDERRREYATMQAFGLPPRSVMGVVTKEGVIVGVLATALGLIAGTAFLSWILDSLAARTLPDLGIERDVSGTTMLIALVVGIVAVATAPLLLYRRVRGMNIPDTLRVME